MRRVLLLLALIAGVVGPVAASASMGLGHPDMLWPLSWLAWAPVGYVILLRRPGNGVGAATLFVGTTMGVSFLAQAIAETGGLSLDLRTWSEMVSLVLGVAPWMGIVWLLLVFPSGNLRGGGERWAGRAATLVAIVAMAAFTVSSEPMDLTGMPSPLATAALEGPSGFIVVGPGFSLVVVLLVVSLFLLVRRMRRSTGVEREQFRWLFFGALLFALVLLAAQFLPEDTPGRFLFLPAGWAIPVTIGVAITRYRLYEIDRIISRTVTYALVVGLLAAMFFGLVTLLAGLLSPDQPLVVAASTLAVFALFNPVRRRIQYWVDKRFNRSRYDAERVIEAFSTRIRDAVDLSTIAVDLSEVVAGTVEPTTASFWLREEMRR